MEIVPVSLSLAEIKAKAESFLRTYHPTSTIPIPIEEIIDNKLRIDIIPIPGLKQALQGIDLEVDGFIATDFGSISVDEYVQKTFSSRYRFTLAHEIAHRELHQYFFKQFDIQSIDDWKVVVNAIPSWPVKIIEYQANDFAGLILVPCILLKAEFYKAAKKADEILKQNKLTNGGLRNDLIIGFLAEIFKVSSNCMRICIERDKLI